jgi:Fe-S-cluster containining protein
MNHSGKLPDIDELKRLRRLGRKMTGLYKELDPAVEKAMDGMKVSCKVGCAGCCHLLTLISLPEAVAIAEHILADPRRRQTIPALSNKFFEQLNRIPLTEASATGFKDLRTKYFATKTPCAFLDTTTNQCTVYSVRPSACRYHFVVTDPELCSPDRPGERVGRVNTFGADAKVLSEANRVSRQTKLPLYIAPLPVAMLWAFKLLIEGRAAFDAALAESAEALGAMNLIGWMDLFERESPAFSQALAEAVGAPPTEAVAPG